MSDPPDQAHKKRKSNVPGPSGRASAKSSSPTPKIPPEPAASAKPSYAQTAAQRPIVPPDDVVETAGPAVPRLSADTDDGDDCLGVERQARAFARIIGSRQTATPLSIGLFGDWGSGKSFFMGLMQRELEARTRAFARVAQRLDADDPDARAALDQRWHGRIAQITFNAWHYAEPNLWASLVTRVFDELARVLNPQEPVEDTRARLLAEVSEGKQRRELAEAELVRAELELAKAQAERERRETELRELREELAVVEAVAPDEASATRPRATTGTVQAPPAAQAPPARLEVGGPLGALRVTVRWIWSRGRFTRIALVTSGALLVLGALLALAWWREWIDLSPELAVATAVLGVVAGVASTVMAWVKLIHPMIDATVAAYKGRETLVDRAVRDLLESGEGPARLARLRFAAARAEVERATAAAEDAAAQLAHRRRQLQLLRGGRRFYDFIVDRDESNDYRRHLGLVSLIRKDFERLEQILTQVEREGPGGGPTPISRIVLYIDDLDRCEPERVVEVLQAVHLLLATPIFVVVVAVDVRWLRRSLTLHYARLLQSGEGQAEYDDEAHPTAKNYLEKIFQIPFSLRPMGDQGFARLVHGLVRADADLVPGPSHPTGDAMTSDDAEPRRAEQELEREVVASIEPAELAFMQGLHAVIDTPRLAKALVNTYRLLRSELEPAELVDYLARQRYRPVLILLAIQVGRSREASVLFEQLGRPDATSLTEVVARLAATLEPRDRWRDLQAALAGMVPSELPATALVPWLERVRRFSFNPWPTR